MSTQAERYRDRLDETMRALANGDWAHGGETNTNVKPMCVFAAGMLEAVDAQVVVKFPAAIETVDPSWDVEKYPAEVHAHIRLMAETYGVNLGTQDVEDARFLRHVARHKNGFTDPERQHFHDIADRLEGKNGGGS